jgi:hypothetical protein
MTIITLQSVGFCADETPVGDRAFRFAADLAERRGLQLNVFAFLQSPFEPYDPERSRLCNLPRAERDAMLVARDRRLREYYDERLGDFLDVGFRVCEDCETMELRRCLKRREFQVLVIPYHGPGATFGNVPVEEFAVDFLSPVVLVGAGPWFPHRLNPQAELIRDQLDLPDGAWLRPHVLETARS